MSDEFSRLVPETRAFLNELAVNNNRDWFLANKPRYEAELRLPAIALLDQVSATLGRHIGTPPTPKLFRPQRDVRFSKDKTPYHLHLHLLWSTPPVGWFFGLGRDYASAGGGVMGLDKDGLTRWRDAVASTKGADLQAVVTDFLAMGARMDEPELKRVPAPYDKDHPRGDLLRRKSMTLWFDFADAQMEKDGLIYSIEAAFEKLVPLQLALRDLL